MKKWKITKRALCIGLVFLLNINALAAVVSDNDGSAFITKAEFDSLKNNFQAQIDSYNTSIDSKIDGAIAQYLAGIQIKKQVTITPIFGTSLVFVSGIAAGTYDSTFQSFYSNMSHFSGSNPVLACIDNYNNDLSRADITWPTRNYGYGYCMGSEDDGIKSVAKYDANKFYMGVNKGGNLQNWPERYFWIVDDINKTHPVCNGFAGFYANCGSSLSGGHLFAGTSGSGTAPPFCLNHSHNQYTTYWKTELAAPLFETKITISKNQVSMDWRGKYGGTYQGATQASGGGGTTSLIMNGNVFTYGNPDGTTTPKNLGNKTEGYPTHYWLYQDRLTDLWCCGDFANPTLWKYDSENTVNWTTNEQYEFNGIINIRKNNRTKSSPDDTLMPVGALDKTYYKDTITLYGMDADTQLSQLIAKPYENLTDFGTHYWDGAILFESTDISNITLKLKENSNKKIYLQTEPFTNAATPTASYPFKVNGTTYTSGFTPTANVEYTITLEGFPKNKRLYIKPAGECIITINEMISEME